MKKDTTRRVPVVPVRGTVVFPHTDTLVSFGRPKSIAAINSAFQEDKVIAIFAQKDPRTADPGKDDLEPVGTIATITQMMSTEGEIHAIIRGQARIKLVDLLSEEPYLIGKVEEIREEISGSPEVAILAKKLQELFKKAINMGKQAEIMTVMKLVSGGVEPIELSDQIAAVLEIKPKEKQKILEEANVKKRLNVVLEYLAKEVNALEIERTISTKTQKRFEDQMKKAMLREKKRTIEEELGEMGEDSELSSEEAGEYKHKIKESGMQGAVKEKAEKELKRLIEMSPNNPEGAYIRNYLDWLTDMPWAKATPNNVAMKKAEKILEADHYGIEKAKERILEFLAVMKIKKESKHKGGNGEAHPTILCFIGPPGVGKTSIGRSIAKALNRKFVRVSLGGIRDEAEIRGHRRTYVGAMPGRIIQGMKDAGTKNPVFMLDEIDKVGVDFRGDPSSALLEALDPEQNKEFSDHYLEVPFDLSEVMFICTGNVLDTIPGPLKDRMEVITFPGYTEVEKFHIAQKFLWPKQLKLTGLEEIGIRAGKKIEITPRGLKEVIGSYTREAGVRNLERNLASICRKIARLVAEGKKYHKKVEVSDVRKFLGSQRFSSQIAERHDEVGMSTGLSVTPFGGEILFIEVSLMPGKGKLLLTGQLGDVMQESAKAAFTWTRSHFHELGLKPNFADKIDVHIHVPEGAVPKDGPSAGVAITTALVSALTGIPVRRKVGMTGEVTLRGRVMEIGGLKEKSIAGHRAGLTTIIAPKENKKDLDEMPELVKKEVKFVFVESVEEVLKVAITTWPVTKEHPKFTPVFSTLSAN